MADLSQLELLSIPITDKDGNATPYFEDAWFKIITYLGGEGADNPVSRLEINKPAQKPKKTKGSEYVTVTDTVNAHTVALNIDKVVAQARLATTRVANPSNMASEVSSIIASRVYRFRG